MKSNGSNKRGLKQFSPTTAQSCVITAGYLKAPSSLFPDSTNN